MDTAIDLRQFRYFVALCEERNFGRAAARLHLSQPPLSRQIRLLEERLGVALFVRMASGVALTEAAAALLPEARQTLMQAEKAIAAARAANSGNRRQFAVGYTTVVDRAAIPDVVDALRRDFPDWRFVSSGKHSIRLITDLKNGTLDAAFIGLHTQCAGLCVEPLLVQAPVVALPAGHRLARKRRIGFADLAGEAIFWFERRLNPGFYDYFQAYFERTGFTFSAVPEPADHHVLLGLIAEGKGLALMAPSLRRVRRQGVVFRVLKTDPEPPTMGIAVAYAANNPSPVLPKFLALVRALRHQ